MGGYQLSYAVAVLLPAFSCYPLPMLGTEGRHYAEEAPRERTRSTADVSLVMVERCRRWLFEVGGRWEFRS